VLAATERSAIAQRSGAIGLLASIRHAIVGAMAARLRRNGIEGGKIQLARKD